MSDNTQASVNSIPVGELLQHVLDEMLEGLQIISKDLVYLYVNDTVAKQGKKKKEELIGRSMMECYPGIEKTVVFEQIKISLEKNVSIRMENEFNFPDGSKGWFQLYIHPWEGGVIIFSINITDRRIMEEKLLTKVNELNMVMDVAVDREKKMADLKQTIEKLHAVLQKTAPAILT